jgi:hypothetical protein
MKSIVLVVSAALLALAGCSQVKELAPVSGDTITSVRNATYDVLVDQQVDILEAPVCTTNEAGFTCIGSTIDGSEIRSTASGTTPIDLVVEVDGQSIFTGTVQDVLDAALLEAS